jgi:hypothetical protein
MWEKDERCDYAKGNGYTAPLCPKNGSTPKLASGEGECPQMQKDTNAKTME